MWSSGSFFVGTLFLPTWTRAWCSALPWAKLPHYARVQVGKNSVPTIKLPDEQTSRTSEKEGSQEGNPEGFQTSVQKHYDIKSSERPEMNKITEDLSDPKTIQNKEIVTAGT